MNCWNILIFLSICLANLTTLLGQPCGPDRRLIDLQTITSNGDILLLRTEFNGSLMDVYNNNKEFDLNYVLISPRGKIKKDTFLILSWKEWHYNYMSCCASYRIPSQHDYKSTNEKSCVYYSPYSQSENTIVSYFLAGDRKFAYEIIIDEMGIGNWTLCNLGAIGLSNEISLKNDSIKSSLLKSYLTKKHKGLGDLPTEQFEFSNEKTKITVRGRKIEFHKKTIDNKWLIRGEKWELALDGNLFHYFDNQPLINFKGKVAYVTVFNEDYASCPSYGQDIFPITYAIDLKKGKIIWQRKLQFGY